jgi:outer membrane receptor protein involved in Fe transport
MKLAAKTLLFSVVLLFATSALADDPVQIGIMDFEGKAGMTQEKADVIADIIAEYVSRMGNIRVISKADIASMLNLEKQKRLAGCTDKDCFAEVAGALGMPWMLTGNVGRFGESFVLNLKLVDVRNVYVAGRESRTFKGEEDDLLNELPGAIRALFEKVSDRLGLALSADEVKSASKHRQSVFWSPSAVSVYTRQEIRSSGAVSLVDFLRRVPGFDVYELKPSYPLIGARALTEESNNLVLVLIDGRESLIEFAGLSLMRSLSIHPEEVERIEVIRGPGSALYGANAFSAVVSITTVAEEPRSGADVLMSGGETGTHDVFGRVRGAYKLGSGKLSFSVGIGAEGTDSPSGRGIESFRTYYRSHGHLRYRRDRLDLSLHTGLVRGDGMFFSTPGDLFLDDGLDFWVMGKTAFLLGESTNLKAQLYYTRGNAHFVPRTGFRAYDIWIADFPDFPVTVDTFDTQVQLDQFFGYNFLLLCGANMRYTNFASANHIPSEYNEFRGAGFIQANWSPMEMIQFTGGLRLDLSTEYVPALSPRVSMVYRPVPAHALRLSYGLAFRKPSIYESRVHAKVFDYNPAIPEVVSLFAEQFGNEKLVNEKVHSLEAGWLGLFLNGAFRVSADAFLNVYKDSIAFIVDLPLRLGLPDISDATVQYQNASGGIYAFGGETELSWRVNTVREALQHGKRSPAEPRLKVNLGGRYQPDSGFLLDASLHCVSRYKMPLKDPLNLLDPPALIALGNDVILMSRLGYRTNLRGLVLEAGLAVRTPLGAPHREYAGTSMPRSLQSDSPTDYGGEYIIRKVIFYLRGSL